MSEHSTIAKELFTKGYNCSQSVVLAFCDETGLDSETALKISSSFGGGMGRLREVCGAVSGMFIVAGRECKIVCVNRYCMNLLYAPYWGKQR